MLVPKTLYNASVIIKLVLVVDEKFIMIPSALAHFHNKICTYTKNRSTTGVGEFESFAP